MICNFQNLPFFHHSPLLINLMQNGLGGLMTSVESPEPDGEKVT